MGVEDSIAALLLSHPTSPPQCEWPECSHTFSQSAAQNPVLIGPDLCHQFWRWVVCYMSFCEILWRVVPRQAAPTSIKGDEGDFRSLCHYSVSGIR